MNRQHQQRNARSHGRDSAPSRWRVGNANVSTEELRAWQLGPARAERWPDNPSRSQQS